MINQVSTMISFKGKQFLKDIILMAVRWYVAYALSYRDLEEILFERGVKVDYSTLSRWIIEYAPQLEKVFSRQYKKKANANWLMDETYIKVKDQWHYLYRAADKFGQTIDFMLSTKGDEAAANAFFIKAIGHNSLPNKITIDKSGANKASLDHLNLQLFVLCLLGYQCSVFHLHQNKYLNNLIEQDHRGLKRIVKPMMGFKSFDSAKATIAGIELHWMLKKKQQAQANNSTAFEQLYALAA